MIPAPPRLRWKATSLLAAASAFVLVAVPWTARPALSEPECPVQRPLDRVAPGLGISRLNHPGDKPVIDASTLANRRTDFARCELAGVLVAGGGSVIEAPAAEGTAVMIVHYDDGGSYELTLTHEGDGELVAEEASATPDEIVEGTPPSGNACDQLPYSPYDFAATNGLTYYTNVRDFRPASMTGDQARGGFKAGFNNILTSYNDCGLADVMPLSATLAADTARRPVQDGVNTTAFGDTGTSTGATRLYWTGAYLGEFDVEINSIDFNFVRNITGSCVHSRHMDSTMTHEVGHVYGLRDLYTSGTTALTLYGVGAPCNVSKVTIGLGDWRGLDAKY